MVKVKKVSGKVAKKTVAAVKKEVNKVNITGKISKVKKTAKETSRKVKQQLLKTKKQNREETLKKVCEGRGVVYIKHIPHGFYEKEMYEYFKQFGTVTAIKLPRSKNGKSKGFAFIEFEYKEIAKIVADTMNNYLMFNQLLKTEYIPPEKQKPHFFHRASMPWNDTTNKDAADRRRDMDRVNKNKPILDPVEFVKKTKRTVKRMRDTLLKKTGFDYEFQVNEPEIEKVQLIGAKRRSRDPTPINDVKPSPKKTKATPRKTKPTPRKTKAMPRKTKATPRKTKATPRKTKS